MCHYAMEQSTESDNIVDKIIDFEVVIFANYKLLFSWQLRFASPARDDYRSDAPMRFAELTPISVTLSHLRNACD